MAEQTKPARKRAAPKRSVKAEARTVTRAAAGAAAKPARGVAPGAATNAEAASSAPRKKPVKFGNVALRDLALVAAALSLWAAADAWYLLTGLEFANSLAIVDGILVGLALASLGHEWGHYAGARATDAKARLVRTDALSLLRFRYDMEANDSRQFNAMSIGGNVAHWSVVVLLFLALPMDSPGRIALIAGAFGFAIFATVTEAPVIARSARGMSPRESLGLLDRERLIKNGFVGAVAGGLAFAFLS
jgi:hypothetical protein